MIIFHLLLAVFAFGQMTSDQQQDLYNKLPSDLQKQTSIDYICKEMYQPSSRYSWDLVHRYEPLKQIGKGNQAVVYKAMDHCTNTLVAVKVFKNGKVGNQEYQSLRQVKGVRGCMQVKNQLIKDEVFYLVLDYYDTDVSVHMENLVVVQNRDVSMPDIQLITREVSHCLAHIAQKLGAQHNDVKLDNILLLYKKGTQQLERVALADLGGFQPIGQVGKTFTASYVAPERLEGTQVSRYTSDAYSMASTVFVMFSGTFLFNFKNNDFAEKILLAQYIVDLKIQKVERIFASKYIYQRFGQSGYGLEYMTSIFKKFFQPLEKLVKRQEPQSDTLTLMFQYLEKSFVRDPAKRMSSAQAQECQFFAENDDLFHESSKEYKGQ